MKKIGQVVLAGCLLWMLQANAEIYKWRDEKGIMNYSDVPPQAGANSTQKIKAATVPNDVPLTRSDAYQHDEPAPINPKPMVKPEGSNAAPTTEAEALKAMQDRLKAQNCASARSNYRNYAVGGRMQAVTEDGQKEYLTDEQVKDGLAKAQQDIDENCPPE